MRFYLLLLTFGFFFLIPSIELSAQNASISAHRSFSTGSTGLQSHSVIRVWRGLFVPGMNRWDSLMIVDKKSFLLGGQNTATGTNALISLTTGLNNTADGYDAIGANTTGSFNTGVGFFSLQNSITGSNQTAVGALALQDNGQSGNTALGASSLEFNATGSNNTAVGLAAMTGQVGLGESNSVAIGAYSLYQSVSTTGFNAATGSDALYSNTTGGNNVANGAHALYANTTGSSNTAMGYKALNSTTTGKNNTAVGYFAVASGPKISNAMALGANSIVTANNSVVVGATTVTSIGGFVNWTNFSDGRYKRNIQQNVPGLTFINKLNPVTYTLDIEGIENKLHEGQNNSTVKNLGASVNEVDVDLEQSLREKSAISYTGFVAQDVEKAADFIGYKFSGIDKPKDVNQSFYGLRYSDFVVPLVKAVQELSVNNDRKDSVINFMQGKMDSLQVQINELRSFFLTKNQAVSSIIPGASLDQNVPNPMTNSTIIGYSLPQGVSTAQMQVTDMSGKIVQIISLSGVGRNTLTIDTSSFASGIYGYSLFINGQLAGTKKMITAR